MRFHDELNPKLWTKDNELKQEVAEKLEEITQAFIEYLDIPLDAIEDVIITGSSANYNYTPQSDLDLHLRVDYDKVHEDCPIVEGYLWSMKAAFNKDHDISIYGVPVEVYAENVDIPAVSNGVYSLADDKWIKFPEKIPPTDNDLAVQAKFNELKEASERIEDSEVAEELLDKIYAMRKAGLADVGEFSTENMAFKMLRNEGIIDKLKQMKKEKIDKQLTLESFIKVSKKLKEVMEERPPMTFEQLINKFKDNIEEYKIQGKDVYDNLNSIIKETLPIYVEDMINIYKTSEDYFDPHLDDTLEDVLLEAISQALNTYFIRNMTDLI